MTTKAFGYVRVSGTGQLKGHGPERQRDDIQAFAARNGIEVAAIYQDAWTGTDNDRPEFMAMLEAMMTNGIRTVIVESMDRFARDLAVQMQLIAKLVSAGITLIPANTGQPISSESLDDNPMLKAMVQIQGVFAELDKSLTVRKLRKARDAKRQATGRCEGRKPFGTADNEAATLDRIKRLRRKPRGGGKRSCAAVAEVLNAEGLATRTGKPWNRGTVHAICQRLGW
jgi:DNA invertase Pin-like site-specific DNA recombinase